MGKHYVIEHMEPDEASEQNPIPDWALLEYRHILLQVGLYDTNNDKESIAQDTTQRASLSSSTSFSNLKELASSQVTFSHLSKPTCEALINSLSSYTPSTTTSGQTFKPPIIRHLRSLSGVNPNVLKSPDHVTCSVLSIMDLMSALRINIMDICLLDPKSQTPLSSSDRPKFKLFLFGGILGDDPPRDRTAELRAYGFPTRHLGNVQMTTDTAVAVTKRVIEDSIELNQLDYVDRPQLLFGQRESVEMPFRYLKNELGEPIMPQGMKELIHKDMNKSFEF